MAKKSKLVEKETRRLMESISDMVKKRDGRYQFKKKHKKKQIRRLRMTCVHWIYRKGREIPTVITDPNDHDKWRCTICGATFPVRPMPCTAGELKNHTSAYDKQVLDMLETINQIQFWGVKLGGDKEDTKMFLELRHLLPRFRKVSRNIVKNMMKRETVENNPDKNNVMASFDSYSTFSFRQ